MMEEKVKEVMLSVAREAGAYMKSRFQGSFKVENKEGRNNLVTEVDLACEQIIVETIMASFPDHALLTEERGRMGDSSPYRWIIDPIDGTTNFAHGLPLCCLSIGWEAEGEMIMGVIYNPMMDELYFAEKGKGAWKNEERLSVSKQSRLDAAFLVSGFPYHWPPDQGTGPAEVFTSLVMKGIPVRRLGSAALDLCYVAAGHFDGFWEYSLQPWDIAAGYLMVEEAGGRVSDFHGCPGKATDQQTLATNGLVHEALREHIGQYLRRETSDT